MTTEKRYCLHCQELLKGRSDQRYCDDACRNAFFNEKSKNEHSQVRAIDLALKKNRRILMEFLRTDKIISVTENNLLQKGFDFKYHTHQLRTTSGLQYWFCYDYGYLQRKPCLYIIVKEMMR
jgi:hypothetical protein